jgi:hypothetical protein
MGVYVNVSLHNGQPLAHIEIRREADQKQPTHSMHPMLPGRFRYTFDARVKHPTSKIDWQFTDTIEHERTDDVLALLKAVIDRVQEIQETIGESAH